MTANKEVGNPFTLKSHTLSSELFSFSLYKSLPLRVMHWQRWWKESNCDVNCLRGDQGGCRIVK
jgi:hypothetical protein